MISYPSGERELVLASFVTAVYLFVWSIKSKQFHLATTIQAFMYLVLPVTIIYTFFERATGKEVILFHRILPWSNHPISLYMLFVVGIIFLFLLTKERKMQDRIGILVYLLWVISFSLIQFLNTTTQFFSIPVSQRYFFILFLFGIASSIFINLKRPSRD